MTEEAVEARRTGRFHPSARQAIRGILLLQLTVAALLIGGDLAKRMPDLARDRAPQFDRPVGPGDQTRRYAPARMPLDPDRQRQPFESTGDMPDRLAFEMQNNNLRLYGRISEGDAARFETYLLTLAAMPETVVLNSAGGVVAEALEIAALIRERGMNTALEAGDICLSACPYVLVSGVERRVAEGGRVGVHQHYFDVNTVLPAFLAVENIQQGQGRVMAHLVEMGADPRLMIHALQTPPEEIYVFLPEQLEEYAIVTGAPEAG